MQLVSVYLQPFWRNSLLNCVSLQEIVKNSLKPLILGVQGHSRPSVLIALKTLSPVLVIISRLICNRFYAIRANIGKMRTFVGGTLLSCPCSRRTPSPSSMKFRHKKLESMGQPTVKIL